VEGGVSSPDNRDVSAPPGLTPESTPIQPVAGDESIVWGPPARPDDPPFGAPQATRAAGSWGARSPLSGAARAAPDAVDRGGVIALMLGVAGIFFVIFPPLGLAFGILSIRAAVRARRRAAADGIVAPGAGAGLATGIAATIASTIVMIVAVLFFSELRDYQDCMAGANTNTAEDDCRDQLNTAIERRLGID
jgi:hypothetical protein